MCINICTLHLKEKDCFDTRNLRLGSAYSKWLIALTSSVAMGCGHTCITTLSTANLRSYAVYQVAWPLKTLVASKEILFLGITPDVTTQLRCTVKCQDFF